MCGGEVRIKIECALEFVDRLFSSPPCKGHPAEREVRPLVTVVEFHGVRCNGCWFVDFRPD